MHRRDVLQFLGAAILAPPLTKLSPFDRWLAGRRLHQELADAPAATDGLDPSQLALVSALADTLIPRTTTPGALDVLVPRFIDRLVAEWYPEGARGEILAGLTAIDARAGAIRGNGFVALDAEGRGAVISALDLRATPGDPAETTWRTLRDQIVFGYLTSEAVSELIRTMPIIPGRFDGCVPVGGTQ